MKKLLGAALALTLGVTLTVGLAACNKGGNNNNGKDAAAAKSAIESIKATYADKSAETVVSYSVLGSTKIDTTTYTVTWSATSENENLDDYLSIGEMDEDTKLVPVSVTLGEVQVDYTLTATIKVGKATETADFEWYVPAGGTKFTPSEAIAEAKKLESGDYYKEDGEVVAVRVTGYVVDEGSYDESYGNYNKIYIGDTAETAKNDAFYIYRVQPDGYYLKKDGTLLNKGDKVTFRGYIQRYMSTYELTYYNKFNVYCVAVEAADVTDDDIVKAAKEKVSLSPTYFVETKSVTLPEPSNTAKFEWTVVTDTDLVSISSGKLVINKLPTAETEVEIKVTITSGSAKDEKVFKITVAPNLALEHEGTQTSPYTASEANKVAKTLANGGYSDQIYVRGYVVDAGEWSSQYNNWNKVYIADSMDSEDMLYVYRIVLDGTFLKAEGDLVVGDIVTLTGFLNNYEGTIELNYKGGISITCVGIEKPGMDDKAKAQSVIDSISLPASLASDYPLPESSIAGVTLEFESNNTSALEISGGKLVVHRGNADVTVTITITADCNGQKASTTKTIVVKRSSIPADELAAGTTVKVVLADYSIANNWFQGSGTEATAYDTVIIDKNITVTATGTPIGSYGLNTGKYYNNGTWRIYQNENPRITFTTSNNAKILTIKITYTVSNTGVLISADGLNTQYASGTVITVDDTTVTFTVGNTGDKSNGQVQIKEIEVVYSGGAQLTNAEKVERVKESFKFTDTQYNEAVEGINLPGTSGEATLTWSVKNTADEEYATVTSNVLTIVKLPEEGTKEVTLTVRFDIGDAHAEKDIVITILSSNAKGTRNNPYTAAEAVTATNLLASGDYSTAPVYVTGYVIVVGTWGDKYSNFTGTYIADSLDSTTSSANAIQIYGLCLDDTYLTNKDNLVKGALITVYGYLKNHNGNTPEITYDTAKTIEVKAVAFTAPTDEAKVYFALAALNNTLPNVTKAEDVTLPVSTIDGVTFTWTSDNSTYTVSEGKLVVSALPEEDVTVTLTVTATCGSVNTNNTKTVTVIIKKASSGNEQVEPIVVDAENLLKGKSNYTSGTDMDVSGYKFDYTDMGKYNESGSAYWLQMRKNQPSTFWNTTAFSAPISKIVIAWNAKKQTDVRTNALKFEFADNANFTNAKSVQIDSTSDGSANEVIAPDGGNYTYIRISNSCSNALYVDSFTIVFSAN